MGYEIYTSGEVCITPPLPDGLIEQIEAFTQRDLEGEASSIPFPVDADGSPRRFCDWEVYEGNGRTILQSRDPAYMGWEDWLGFLIAWINSEVPGAHTFDGTLFWEGDNSDDRGRVIVEADGKLVVQEQIDAVYEGSAEAEWAQSVQEYFRNQPPTGLGRILTI